MSPANMSTVACNNCLGQILLAPAYFAGPGWKGEGPRLFRQTKLLIFLGPAEQDEERNLILIFWNEKESGDHFECAKKGLWPEISTTTCLF